MKQQTPGSWSTKVFDDSQTVVLADGKRLVAVCTGADKDDNARLISASKDLLEALKYYVAICGNTASQIGLFAAREMFAKADAAISKAEGRS